MMKEKPVAIEYANQIILSLIGYEVTDSPKEPTKLLFSSECTRTSNFRVWITILF